MGCNILLVCLLMHYRLAGFGFLLLHLFQGFEGHCTWDLRKETIFHFYKKTEPFTKRFTPALFIIYIESTHSTITLLHMNCSALASAKKVKAYTPHFSGDLINRSFFPPFESLNAYLLHGCCFLFNVGIVIFNLGGRLLQCC